MAKRRNELTSHIRTCVANWLSATVRQQFTVAQICSDLWLFDDGQFEGVNLIKAVSNEMARLVKIGIIHAEQGSSDTVSGTGRPGKLYRKVYCQKSIDIIKAGLK